MGKGPEKPQNRPGKTVRALLAATLFSTLPSAASAGPRPGMEPKRYLDESYDQRPKHMPEKSDIPEVGEEMESAELQTCQRGMTTITEFFLNSSCQSYLAKEKPEKYEEMVKALISAFGHFDQLFFEEKSGITTIKKRPTSHFKDIPDDFKIVIDNGFIVEIGGEELDKSKYLDLKEFLKKFNQFRAGFAKQEDPNSVYMLPDELEEFGTSAEFNLVKFFLEYLKAKKEISKEEADYLRDNKGYDEVVANSPKYSRNNRNLIVRIREYKGGILIIVKDMDELPLLAFSPDGHLYRFNEDGDVFTPIGPPDLYSGTYWDKRADKLAGVPRPRIKAPVPEIPEQPEQTSETDTETEAETPSGETAAVPPATHKPSDSSTSTPEAPKTQKLGETIRNNPRIILTYIEDPKILYNFRPITSSTKKLVAFNALIGFLVKRKDKPWVVKATDKLKEDIESGEFVIPDIKETDDTLEKIGKMTSFASKYLGSFFDGNDMWEKGELAGLIKDYFYAK